MHITDDKDLTVDRIARLIIREEIEGTKFAIKFEKSSLIVSSSGEAGISIKSELEDEEILDFFEKEAAHVLEAYQIDSLELDCIQVLKGNKYLFPAPVIVLEGATATKDGQVMYLSPDAISTMSAHFGTVSVPQMSPPTSLLLALQKGSKGTLHGILKRLRQYPSLYGVAEHTPTYYACLGKITAPEEKDMKWHI